MVKFSCTRFFALLDASKGLGNFILWVILSLLMYYRIWEYTLVRYIWATRPGARLHPVLYLILTIVLSPWMLLIIVGAALLLPAMEIDLLPAFFCNVVLENPGSALSIALFVGFAVSVLLINLVVGDVEKALAEQGIVCRFNRLWVALFQSFYVRSKLHALYAQQPEQEKTLTAPFDQDELFALLDSHVSLFRSIVYCCITLGVYAILWLYVFVKYVDTCSENTGTRFFAFLLTFQWGFMLSQILWGEDAPTGLFTIENAYTILLLVFLLVQFVAKAGSAAKKMLEQKGIPVTFNIVLQVLFSLFYYHCKFHKIYTTLRRA